MTAPIRAICSRCVGSKYNLLGNLCLHYTYCVCSNANLVPPRMRSRFQSISEKSPGTCAGGVKNLDVPARCLKPSCPTPSSPRPRGPSPHAMSHATVSVALSRAQCWALGIKSVRRVPTLAPPSAPAWSGLVRGERMWREGSRRPVKHRANGQRCGDAQPAEPSDGKSAMRSSRPRRFSWRGGCARQRPGCRRPVHPVPRPLGHPGRPG